MTLFKKLLLLILIINLLLADTTKFDTKEFWSNINLNEIEKYQEVSFDDNATLLIYASKYIDDKKIFEKLIASGIDINQANDDGITPLFNAILNDKNETIETLISLGANVNFKSNYKLNLENMSISTDKKPQTTPLMLASSLSKANIVKQLVKNGAQINLINEQKATPLHIAISSKSDYNTTKVLIDLGADINAKANRKVTPLYTSIFTKSNDLIIKLLIDSGADINARVYHEFTPLMMASRRASLRTIKYLVNAGARTNDIDENNQNSLYHAIWENRDIKIIQYLLDQGSKIDIKSKKDYNAIVIAILNHNIEIVKLLLENGANVNEKREFYTLKYLIKYLKIELHNNFIKKMIEDAIKNKKDSLKITVFELACVKSNKAMIETLVKGGAKLPDNILLDTTLFNQNLDTINYLIELGANLNYNANGLSVLMYSLMFNNNYEVIKTLIDNGADASYKIPNDSTTTIMIASGTNANLDILKLLIKNGADINAKTSDGFTAVRLASMNDNIEVIKTLLDLGANIDENAFLTISSSIRMYDSKINKNIFEIIDIFKEAGFDINNIDEKNDKTILMKFIPKMSRLETLQTLIKRGMDISIKNSQDKIALDFLSENKNLKDNAEAKKLLTPKDD